MTSLALCFCGVTAVALLLLVRATKRTRALEAQLLPLQSTRPRAAEFETPDASSDEQHEQTAADQRRRRFRLRIRYSMRTFLAAFLLLCAVCGWVGYQMRLANSQRKARLALSAATRNAEFCYEYQQGTSDGQFPVDAEKPGPPLLRDVLGVDYFSSVVSFWVPDRDDGVRKPGSYVSPYLAPYAQLPRREPLADGDLKHLRGLPRLKLLNLNFTSITDEGIGEIASLSELEELALAGTDLTGATLGEFSGLKKLRLLDLSGTRLTDQHAGDLAKLRQLRELLLIRTKLTDQGVAQLAELGELRRLVLGEVPVGDASLEAIATLPHLHELDVDVTHATSRGIAHLASMKSLRYLSLDNLRLDRPTVEVLKKLTQLRRFSLRTPREVSENSREGQWLSWPQVYSEVAEELPYLQFDHPGGGIF